MIAHEKVRLLTRYVKEWRRGNIDEEVPQFKVVVFRSLIAWCFRECSDRESGYGMTRVQSR